MSWQACAWAINQQLVTRPSERHVLLTLANNADDKGKNAFPSIRTLARATGYGERAVQKILRRLEEAGALRLGDQRIAAVKIDRADRRPTVYDLAVEIVERGERGSPRDADGVNGEAPRGERGDTNGVNGGSPERSLNQEDKPSLRARGGGDPDGPPPRGAGGAPQGDAGPWEAIDREEASEGRALRPPLTEAERAARDIEARAILEWAETGALPDFTHRQFGLTASPPRAIDAERAVLSRDTAGARRAGQLAHWAALLADGVPGTRAAAPGGVAPTKALAAVARLAAAIGPPGSARQARGRTARLLEAHEARRVAASATGPPETDDRRADGFGKVA